MYGKRKLELKPEEIISCIRQLVNGTIPYKYNYPMVLELVHYGFLKKISDRKFELVIDNYDDTVKPIETFWAW